MTMLDAIGPYEVLRNIKDAEIKFVSKTKSEITADSGFLHLNAKYSIDEIHQADILLIPGSTVAFIKQMKDKSVLEWIKKIDATTCKTVTVCTGSIILSATGLLKDRKASSHWKAINMMKEYGAIPTRERIVEDGKYISAAGVSAGIDMALYLVSQLVNEKQAKAAQLTIEYDPKPPFDSGNYLTAEKDIIALSEKIMQSGAQKELSAWDMIKNAKSLIKLKKEK